MCLNHPDLVHKHPTHLWDGVVRVGSMCLNHPETHHHRASKVCRVLLHFFGVVQAQRTYTNHTNSEMCRVSKVCRVLTVYSTAT